MTKKMNQKCYIVVVYFLCIVCRAKMQFSVNPVDSFAPLGSNATFSCQTHSNSTQHTSWIVMPQSGGQFDTALPAERSELEMRGILLAEEGEGVDNAQLGLIVLASLENNGTSLLCREVEFLLPPFFSKTANLIVIGPPLSPTLNVHLITTNEFVVEWEEPFTWSLHQILGYQLQVLSPDGSTTSHNTTGLSHTYVSETQYQECVSFTFMVSAFSDLGSSPPSIFVKELPIVPTDIGDVQSNVNLQQNGIIVLTIDILNPPHICEYQTAQLILKVQRTDEGPPLPIMAKEYSGQPNTPEFLSISCTTGLELNQNYSSTVTVSTALGNISSMVIFNTTFAGVTALDGQRPERDTCHSRDWLLAGAAVLCLVLILITISLLATLLCMCRHFKRNTTSSDALKVGSEVSKEKLFHYTT